MCATHMRIVAPKLFIWKVTAFASIGKFQALTKTSNSGSDAIVKSQMKFIFIFLQLLYAQENTEKQPNIIYVLADDLGWGDVNWNNKESYPKSCKTIERCWRENDDKLKRESIPRHFWNHFCQTAIQHFIQRVIQLIVVLQQELLRWLGFILSDMA